MEINRKNYELYFINYLDGELDPARVKMLLSFLEDHPDLKRELEEWQKVQLVPSGRSYPDKQFLHKACTPFEERCIDSIEHQLSREEEKQFLGSIGDDTYKKILYEQYRSVRLVADRNIRFPGRIRLKKHVFRNTSFRILAAASVAAAVMLTWVFVTEQETGSPGLQEIPLAEKREPIIIHSTEETKDPEEIIAIQAVKDNQKAIADLPAVDEPAPDKIQLSPIPSLSISRIETPAALPLFAMVPQPSRQPINPGKMGQVRPVSQALPETNLPELAKEALWMLADAGVRGINRIAEEEVELNRRKDPGGRTKEFKFETPVFGISAPVRNTGKSR